MLYFKQIEIGPMQNYVYLIGSTETRKVAVVDAAWEIDTILKIAAQDDVEVTHAFVTHTHPDHVGGHFSGIEIPWSERALGANAKLKVVVHKAEADALKGLAPSDIIKSRERRQDRRGRNRDSIACTRPATRRDRSVSSSMDG